MDHKTEKVREKDCFQAWLHVGIETTLPGPSFLCLSVWPCSPQCVVIDRFLLYEHNKATTAPDLSSSMICTGQEGRVSLSLSLNRVHQVLGLNLVGPIRPHDRTCINPSA